MNLHTQRLRIEGAAGAIEVLQDAPGEGGPVGTTLICHPHPLFGGTMDNKVVQTLARAFVQAGWRALRFNFRGVGASAGTHDGGAGETDDALEVLRQLAPDGPIALAGFSFGSFVAASAAVRLWEARPADRLVLVGTAASRFQVPVLPPQVHDRTLVIHGEQDDTVPLAAVLDWARPQSLPVTVIPGVEHFFHGQLPLLKSLVLRHLRS
ncbi:MULTISPECIES: alpha/beta fold hydrolase [Ramlibacter]|uniref:Alpha/beta fold hydrolase n=1 Tax=Ramlibacter aquaticus TaxID=2780094 RepID=A0ABR9SH30_9BURK|nr:MULTISPECIES: alpha/beta fold hydrolase [Ramlibacter]MBE7941661.1 alpha/beta fold hydrolase [Ramlibacter aquaticus]